MPFVVVVLGLSTVLANAFSVWVWMTMASFLQ